MLWYRKIASASTRAAVEDICADMADKRPDMPQEAKNLFTKARIKAYAAEHHVRLVSKLLWRRTRSPYIRLLLIRSGMHPSLLGRSRLSFAVLSLQFFFLLLFLEQQFSKHLPRHNPTVTHGRKQIVQR